VLALGGSATQGNALTDRLREGWPYRVFAALPRTTVFVNGALDGATVAEAISTQAPLARELKPDIVEMWLGAEDVRAATPIPAFTSSFSRLLTELRAAGAGRMLVADLPTAYGTGTPKYNDAIHRVVRDAGGELVPLARVRVNLVPAGSVASQPDAASHAAIADAFTAAISSHP
jgi:hypothetical protein